MIHNTIIQFITDSSDTQSLWKLYCIVPIRNVLCNNRIRLKCLFDDFVGFFDVLLENFVFLMLKKFWGTFLYKSFYKFH